MVIVGLVVAASWWWFGIQAPRPTKQAIEAIYEMNDERLSKGETGAPVQMIEYIDMMCADCAKVHQEVIPQIQKKYIDSGKLHYEVRVVSKIYHKDAKVAALGAYCAAEQDKFWSYLDQACQKLSDLPATARGLEDFKLFSGSNARVFAEAVGVNIPTWEHCVKQETYADIIDQHEKAMSKLNAYGTPHSVINGKNYNGPPPFSTFRAVIDAELKKKQEKK